MRQWSFKYRHVFFMPVFFFYCGFTQAQESNQALSWRMTTAYNAYLLRDVHQQYADRQQAFRKALTSEQTLKQYQEAAKARYRQILGELPPKTALHAQIMGKTQYPEFRIERIIFESAPNRHVTANLYIPAGKGPFPATLILSGHGLSGKVSDQKTALAFVRNGIAAFAIDPIAQGERLQLTDKAGKPLTRGATTEHTLLNAGANLVGTSVAAYELHDNLRALDYLETRSEIDKNRLACIGSSGGGTQATYLIGLDDRIKVASVCSYVTQRERTLELSGASDGCQHIPNEGREQLEISDFLVLFAPKPLLIMSGYYDMVDYWGATQVFDELKQVYSVFNQSAKIDLYSLEGGHGMPKPKREAAVTWFRTWLCNDNKPITEPDQAPLPPKDLLCTPSGQIKTAFANEQTLPQHNYALAIQYAPQREAFLKKDKTEINNKVMDILGIKMPAEKIRVEATGTSSGRNYTLQKYQIIRPGQMPIPCLVVFPENTGPASKVVVYLNENSKSELLTDENVSGPYVNRGDILVLADLRGFGETADPLELNDPKYWSKEYRNAMISLHTGKPLMGQRVVDIMSLLDFISTDQKLKNHEIRLKANGAYGPVAIHAAYLDPRIKDTEISRSIKSFEQLVQNPMQKDVYSNVLYGVLKYYDLPDLIKLTGPDKIRFTD